MNKSEILSRIRDEAGTHFTCIFDASELAALEADGLIKIERPVHRETGISYSQDHWTVELTQAGFDYLYPRINKIGMAAIRDFLRENHRIFKNREPSASELSAWATEIEQSIANGTGAEITLQPWEVTFGGFREFRMPAEGIGDEPRVAP